MPLGGLEIGLLLAGIGGGAASAIGSSQANRAAAKDNAEASMEIARLNDERERALAANDDARVREIEAARDKLARDLAAQDEATARADLALKESALDPFRHQMNQASALGRLDMMELGNLGPSKFTPPAEMAQYMPQVSGGFSYEQSPELRASAGALKRDVMGGNVAPTMTNPKNYGKTGAVDILSVMAGGPARATPSAMSEDLLSFNRPVKGAVDAVDPFEPSYDPLLNVEEPGVQGARGVQTSSRDPYSNRSQWGGSERAMKDEPTMPGSGQPWAGLGGAGGDLASFAQLLKAIRGGKDDDDDQDDARRVG